MDGKHVKDGKGGEGLSRGDEVSWKSHGHEVKGKVKKKITKRTRAAGRTVDASSEEPQYEVESEASGRPAVHKPDALRRKGGGSG
ncbi:DUF2945 domain-containing protein [Streptomyces sp. NRRL S-378]|uniref:DUF2945 domain-containing protein n=1 Tax=Streptomyces sp. NRRL S-378 TaxID=1463904 RepID=UPI00068A82D6|nr:DUF2945 domain-containing protein [Streptomyces sp. NRRL S-378]